MNKKLLGTIIAISFTASIAMAAKEPQKKAKPGKAIPQAALVKFTVSELSNVHYLMDCKSRAMPYKDEYVTVYTETTERPEKTTAADGTEIITYVRASMRLASAQKPHAVKKAGTKKLTTVSGGVQTSASMPVTFKVITKAAGQTEMQVYANEKTQADLAIRPDSWYPVITATNDDLIFSLSSKPVGFISNNSVIVDGLSLPNVFSCRSAGIVAAQWSTF